MSSKKLKIVPQGRKILVLPQPLGDYVSTGGIVIANTNLTVGKVVELSTEFKDIYSVGDILLYPEGAGTSQPYKGEVHWWLNGDGAGSGLGDIWAILTEDTTTTKKND